MQTHLWLKLTNHRSGNLQLVHSNKSIVIPNGDEVLVLSNRNESDSDQAAKSKEYYISKEKYVERDNRVTESSNECQESICVSKSQSEDTIPNSYMVSRSMSVIVFSQILNK